MNGSVTIKNETPERLVAVKGTTVVIIEGGEVRTVKADKTIMLIPETQEKSQ